jgi:hypothetical protein
MAKDHEEVAVQVVQQNDQALYLLTKAEIDTQIATAKAFPRSIKEFYDKAISMATVSEDVAASCSYTVPRGGKNIEGATIRLAEIVLAAYKNIRAGARVISNDGRQIVAQGVCHDLENNNSVIVEVTRRITNKKGETFNDDMQVVTGNAACAIALRNAVFKVVPKAMVDEIEEAAKLVAKGTAATLEKRRNAAIEYFKSLKITEKEIFDVLEVKGVAEIDLDKLTILTGMKSAIKNEGANAKDLFNPKADEGTKPVVNKEDERQELLLADCKTIAEVQELYLTNPTLKKEFVDKRIAELEMGVKK